ncbi:MAG: 50S ribosomal protein L11 methyltransferase [Oscillospiraceae bacterium]|jgi:ribosomal protein L11 methyltransferase|nr:50S ribosomal protein L11 methyltransferase [Oscillospiraceae bacterium]
MNWLEVKIFTSAEGIDPLCGRLYNLGINGLQIEDAADFADFIENQSDYWDYIDESLEPLKTAESAVTVYLTDDGNGQELLLLIRESVSAMKLLDYGNSFGRLEISVNGRCDEDWENNWKQYYKPFSLGERILIKPEWEDISDSGGRVVVNMNPGHLFGTGTHHSTQLCMLQLEKYVKAGDRVLDLGCGSGILSILSMLLSAEEAVAVDIDPAAPDTVGENIKLNDIDSSKYSVLVGNVVSDTALKEKIGNNFDIVVANIVADVIIAISEFAYSCVKQGGVFITSGIIAQRAGEVEEALLGAGFAIEDKATQNDWACFTAVK